MFHRIFMAFAFAALVASSHRCEADTKSPTPKPHPIVAGFETFYNVADASREEGGELLLTELNCTACHRPSPRLRQRLQPKPAIVLDGVGSRIRFDYLKQFIANPQAVKPGTTMPNLFDRWFVSQRKVAVDALAHYLASLGGPLQDADDPLDAKQVETGERLYHSTGCVACHAPQRDPVLMTSPPEEFLEDDEDAGDGDEKFEEEELVEVPKPQWPSVPLGQLQWKTKLGPLTDFLTDPLATRPSGRMPGMKLKVNEAKAIASYLLHQTTADRKRGLSPTIDPEKARKGKIFFESLGCALCHHITDDAGGRLPSKFKVKAFHRLNVDAEKGCLGSKPQMGVPIYFLSDAQRTALKAATLHLRTPPEEPSLESQIHRTMTAQNCYACHERDGRGGPEPGRAVYFAPVVEADLGDEGRLPPTLTGVGRKLKPDWLQKMLAGTGDVRPFMATRMPVYGEANVAHLAQAFAQADKDPKPLAIDVSGLLAHHRNRYGRQLLGTNGLSCISCHNLKGHRSIGIPATDLAVVPHRIRPEWFKRYLLNPAALRPGTRMPAFFDKGRSDIRDVFGGNANKQIEAIWIYLKELDQTRLPVGMESVDNFELVPKDRPILLRTFMKKVGAHAITVGYPQGIHFAFDALNAKLAMIWRGKYINAESAWSDRFTPFIDPLSDDRFTLGPTMPFAVLTAGEAPWPKTLGRAAGYQFRGYRLDPAGNPIFLYQFREWNIEDQFTPADDGKSLHRTLTIQGPQTPLWFRPAAANQPPQSIKWQNESAKVEETLSW